MNYSVPRYGVAAPAAGTSTTKIIIIIAIVVVIFIIIALGIGLGVGLGVGLSKNNDDSSSSSSGSSGGSSGSSSSSGGSSSSSTYPILSAPSVTCTYGGSSTCGCSATQPSFLSPRIVQGYDAVAHSWPWIVALYINNNNTFCGGFLISYQYVLTAAHCVYGISANTIIVFAGIQQTSSINSGQSRTVANVTIHPSYSDTSYINDIAVLKLVSAFDQTSTVGQCCVTYDTSLPSIGEHGVIIGWGRLSESSTSISNTLQQGVIQVQTFSSCSSTSTSDIRFCAGYNVTNACFGDSGSPFMTSVNNLWTCTGIVSAAPKCGANTLYTRVSAFQSFINSSMNS